MTDRLLSLDSSDTMLAFLDDLDWPLLNDQALGSPTEINPAEMNNPTHDKVSIKNSKTTPNLKAKKPRKNPNLSWLYRKQELEGLREESKLLAKKLTELQQRRKLAPERWKAGHEMMRLKKSREVQSVLKERLQEHSRVAKAMERIMKNLQEIQEEEFFYNLVALKALAIEHVTSKCLQFANDDVFDVLDERISARQSNLEAILQAKWQEGFIQDSDDVSMNASSGGLELELIKTRMMPFSVENTWSSLWETFHFGMESSSRAGVQVSWRSKTTMALNALYPVVLETGETVNVHVLVVIKGFVVSGGFAAMLEATVGYLTSSVSPRYVTQDSSVILLRNQSFNAKGMKPGVKLHGCQMCLSIKICSSQVNQQHTDENELSEVDVIVSSLRKIVDSRHQIIDNTALKRI